jgi:hypothetical protein
MVRYQLGLRRGVTAGGLRAELDMLSDNMRVALLAANEAYARLGLRYALVGGLCAGAHGRPRFTKDIDFLVGDEAFVRAGLIISFALPMPLQAGDVAIDPIPLPEEPQRKARLEEALANSLVDETTGVRIPILAATPLAYMKLASPRGKDRDDIVGMMEAGTVDLDALRAATESDPVLRERLDAAVAEYEAAQT